MPTGRLEVFAGPMFAGKTTHLIAHVSQARRLHPTRVIKVFKPVTDTRHAVNAVVTHSGQSIEAEWISPDAPDLPQDAHTIALDEGQFFSFDAIPRILEAMARGTNVLVAGLDLTSQGVPFGPMPTLMAFATEVTKLHSDCSRCGRKATRSHRLVRSEDVIFVGGQTMYEPRCLGCFDPAGGP